MGKTPHHPHFDHKLPLWIDPNSATFFITITAQQRGVNHFCKPGVGTGALGAARKYNDDQRWFRSILVLMPDRVHMLVTMARGRDMAKTVGLWKRWLWKKHDIEWQANFFERRLRFGERIDQKGEYIFQNPVRGGLIARAEDWPWTWTPSCWV